MDDPKQGQAAPADAASQPAPESEVAKTTTTEKPKAETEEFVVLAEDDAPEAEAEEADDETEGEGDADKPKRLSRSQRLKAQRDRERDGRLKAEAELAAMRRAPPMTEADEAERTELDALVEKRIGKPPKETDFPNNYLDYDRAMRRWETRAAVAEQAIVQERATERVVDQSEARRIVGRYNERLDQVKDRIPDFDAVLRAAPDLDVRNDVKGLILESEKGPLLAYYFAKNPDRLEEINELPPLQAAKAMGRLEARIRGPQSNKATKASTPVSTPKGGASPAADLKTADMDTYVRLRRAEGAKL